MNTSHTQPLQVSSPSQRDEQLAALVEQVTLLLRQADLAGVEQLMVDHPQHASELQSLLPTLRVLVELQDSGTKSESSPVISPPAPPLGDFRLLREVGRGGMGVVYEAEQMSLSRRVAIKILPFAAVLDPRRLQRFKNEALAAAHLDHPNIVEVYGVGCERCVHFFAMRFIDGQTLARIIADMRRQSSRHDAGADLEPQSREADGDTVALAALSTLRTQQPRQYFRRIADLGIQVADALDHAHQAGIVHRDIKPGNLMLDQQGKIWVTDFGLAHMETDQNLTLSQDLVGTVRYMSPEQTDPRNSFADPRSDIYSLGVTLYELLTLQPAHDAADGRQLLRQIVDAEPVTPRKLVRSVPVDLETIINKCLAKSPADRYATAGQLAADLRRFLAQQPIHARPLGQLARTWRWCRRSPAFATAVAAVFVLLLGVTVLSMAFAARETAHNTDAQQRAAEAQRQADEAKWQQYVSDMHSAMAAYEQSDIGRTREILERHRPRAGERDSRGFEWNYLWRHCQDERILTSFPSDSLVLALNFSHDGRYLATGDAGGQTKIWDAASGNLEAELDGHRTAISRLAFSPDDRVLASAAMAGDVDLWDLGSRATLRVLAGPTNPQADIAGIVYSSDGTRIVCGYANQSLKVFETASGNLQQEIKSSVLEHPTPLEPLAPWNSNGLWCATMDGTLSCFDIETGSQIRLLNRPEFADDQMGQCVMDSSGRLAATGASDGVIRLIDLTSGKETASLGAHLAGVRSLDLASDGRVLASSDNHGKIIVWDLDRRQPRATLQGHSGPVWAIAFSDDGRRLATTGTDRQVNIWDVTRPVAANELLQGHAGQVLCVAFSPDGRKIASGGAESNGGQILVWDAATGRLERSLKGHTNWVWDVAFSPDGTELASAGLDGTVRTWEIATGRPRGVLPAENRNYWVEYTPDGQQLIAYGDEEWLGSAAFRAWESESRKLLGTVHLDKPRTRYATISPDGRYISAGTETGILLLELPTLQVAGRVPSKLRFQWAASFTRDGKKLAVCSGNQVDLISIEHDTVLGTLRHGALVLSVDFSSDGRYLATSDERNEIHLWDVEHLTERAILNGHRSGVQMVCFSPDGQTLASASTDGTVRLWRTSK